MENKVIFIYNGLENIIQCKKEDTMKEIVRKFANKVDINIKEIIFLYGGFNINLDLTYEDIINKDDLKRGEMKILLYNKNNINESNSKIKSKYVICPECKDNCFLNIHNFKISLSGCKNGHKIDNILLNEFEQIQNINESKIKCNKCPRTKNESYNYQFFKCFTCQENLCPLCKSIHDKEHMIIDYDKMNYICNIHNESFISYCDYCKINLCMQCEESHNNHQVIEYRSIMPKKAKIEEDLKELKNNIDKIKEYINKIIDILNEINRNFEIYYKINLDIINNYDIYNRNYQIFQNINEINNNINIKDFDELLNENNIQNQFNILLDIYKKMTDKNNNKYEDENNKMKNENNYQINDKKKNNIDKVDNIGNIITIKYKIDKNNEIKIFGKDFVINNKNNCIIIYNKKEYELQEYLSFNKLNKKVDTL